MTCALCQTSGSFVTVADRHCGFHDGRFVAGNRHCATLSAILALATFKVPSKAGEMHIAFVRGDGGAICVLAWRGSMATIDHAAVLEPKPDAIKSTPLTLAFAEALIAGAGRR